MVTTTKVEHGAVVIPAELRERFGLEEGSQLIAEANEEGILLRPVTEPEIEIYTPERVAEFLLNNAITPEDYEGAVEDVQRLGVDPATVPHVPPPR